MTLPVDLSYLEIAYQIGLHIQLLGTRKKQLTFNGNRFFEGPNAMYDQTRSGLVIEMRHGSPSYILTSFGRWKILGNVKGPWILIFATLKQELGLLKMNVSPPRNSHKDRTFFMVKVWKGKQIPEATFRADKECFAPCDIKKIWREFIKLHQEIQGDDEEF